MQGEDKNLKKEIGKRFRSFREAIHKAQHELASELHIYQSTITNIERGKTFPNIRYLQYFYYKYKLNVNWLLTDEGEMQVTHYRTNPNAASVMDCHLSYNDPRYEKYAELFNFMQIPEVEQVILARLTEAKALFRTEISEFFEKQEEESAEEDHAIPSTKIKETVNVKKPRKPRKSKKSTKANDSEDSETKIS